jgi:hypothetical protein
MGTARNLADLTYVTDPQPAFDLRNAFRDGGFTQPERDVNRALHRHMPTPPQPYKPVHVHHDGQVISEVDLAEYRLQVVEYRLREAMYVAQQVLFDWPCGWGANPGRPLVIIAALALF